MAKSFPLDEASALYQGGASLSDLASKYKVSIGTVHRWLKSIGILRSVKDGLLVARRSGKIYRHKPIDGLLCDKELLLSEYKTQSLTDISKKYQCSRKRLAAAMKRFGIELNRWSQKSKQAQRIKQIARLPRQIFNKDWLIAEYVTNGRGMDDIASELRCSITPIRRQLKIFNIPIRRRERFGHERVPHGKSRGVSASYKPVKCLRHDVRFRSILECGYAVYLDGCENVESWDYEIVKLSYMDGFNGKNKIYICDFVVNYTNGSCANVEVRPKRLQMSEDKFLCAEHQIKNWRWITDKEIELAVAAFSQPNLPITFVDTKHDAKKYVVWSKDSDIDLPVGHRVLSKRRKYQCYYQYRIINDLYESKLSDKIFISNSGPNRMAGRQLDVNVILDLVKQDKTLSQVAKELEVNGRTIKKHLEDRSFVVYWAGSSARHNEIYFVMQKIWPTELLPPRAVVRNRANHQWDNYKWLHGKYCVEKLSLRAIGREVGVSSKLITKKLKKHGIR